MSVNMVEANFPEATVVQNEENSGFAAGVNPGLARARGEFVMLLNSDAELCPGTVGKMLDFMRGHPEVGLVAPKLICPDGRLQINGQKFPTFLREVLGITRLSRLIPRFHDRRMSWGRDDFDQNAEVDSVAGACMLTRKTVVDSVGPLDERFFMYYEDVDWCLRIKQAGWKVYYLGEAHIVHVWAQSSIKLGIHKTNGMLYHSQYLYFRKHHGLPRALALRALSALFLAALKVKYAFVTPAKNLGENGA